MNNIVWKNVPINEFKDSYEVSNNGQIRNKKTKKIKSVYVSSTGYTSVRLDNGIKKTIDVHKLVAEAFIKPVKPKEGYIIVVKFKDGNNQNINVDNLKFDYQIEKEQKVEINIPNQQLEQEFEIDEFKGKKIKDYPNYLISKDGKIYSLISKKIKDFEKIDSGYCRVRLFNGTSNKGKKFYVHQLVAQTYILNPNGYDQVNHKDLNKHNNNINNLEWCDASMNMQHNADNKPNGRKVIQYDKEDNIINRFNSIKEASQQTNTNDTSIIHCCSGKFKTAGGYVWKYAI